MPKPLIEVAAGMILRADGQLLLAQRPSDKPWSGWWELPGGKIEPGETVLQALSRELKEELNIDVTQATPWVTYTHEYPKNFVRLAFCRVTGWNGSPEGVEGQTLAWVDPNQPLPVGPLLPATEPPLRWLQLPDQYLVSSIGSAAALPRFLEKLTESLESGIRLVQFREPAWAVAGKNESPLRGSDDSELDSHEVDTHAKEASLGELDNTDNTEVHDAFLNVLQRCRQYGAQCLVNSCHPQRWWPMADGVHFSAADAREYLASARPDATGASPDGVSENLCGVIGVSAHTAAELALARELNADFAVLGHVLDTPSHPDQPGIGWEKFTELSSEAGLPVFAIGGQSAATLEQARQHGAHGIAGIRYLAA